MNNPLRKAISGTAAVIIAATTAFMMTGSAGAATATPAVQSMQYKSAIHANAGWKIPPEEIEAPPVALPPVPTIRVGDSGPLVTLAQAMLHFGCRFFLLPITGIFDGPTPGNPVYNTFNIVQIFQKNTGLPSTGIIDQATWNTLTASLQFPGCMAG